MRDLHQILPRELRGLPHWVCWRYTERRGQMTKPPVDPRTGHLASVNAPQTWASLDLALIGVSRWRCDGVGFVLNGTGSLTGIDLDKCIDIETSQIDPWAQRIVSDLCSYTEISPSGRGLRIFVHGTLPASGIRKGRFEMYCRGRYLTVTGNPLKGTPAVITTRADEVQALYNRIQNKSIVPISPRLTDRSDSDILQRASTAANGPKFARLYRGDWEADYATASEADLALSRMLAYWTGNDLAKVDQLFRQSGLMRPKWERDDYRKRTLRVATGGFRS